MIPFFEDLKNFIGTPNATGGSATAGNITAKINALFGRTSASQQVNIYETAGTYTWTRPTGITIVDVKCQYGK